MSTVNCDISIKPTSMSTNEESTIGDKSGAAAASSAGGERASRRSGRNRNVSDGVVGNEDLKVVSYDVEYDYGAQEENVIPLNIMNRYLES